MSLGRRLIGLACLLLAGCAGSQPSRELSRETLAQVIQYEDQLNNMSRVLQANYRVTANDMGNDVAWASRTSERTSRAILADDAVDKLIKDGYTEKSLRDFLEAVVAATDGSRAKFAELNAKQVAAEAEAINMTSVEGKILQTTRTRLEQLQREPSLEDRAAQIKPLLEAAIKAMQKEKKPSESVGAGT